MNKKLKNISWYGSNIFLPIYELRTMLRSLRYMGRNKISQTKHLKMVVDKKHDDDKIYSFEEAVDLSGRSANELIAKYTLTKRLWLILLYPFGLFTAIMLISAIMNASDLTFIGSMRVFSLLLAFFSFSLVLFSGALKCQYRLWQLHSKELGSFQKWKSEKNILASSLSWWVK